MAWDFGFATWMIKKAKQYTDSVALNGVPVNYPQVDPATKRWRVYDPVAGAYIDIGGTAEGKDGLTPTPGANGNWWIGGVDTGAAVTGLDGKSAYQIWLDNGNTGTQQDFLDSLKATGGGDTLAPSDLTAHNASATAHDDIRAIIDSLAYVKGAAYNSGTGDLTFTYWDNSTLVVNLLIADLIKGLDYDSATNELVITRRDDTEARVDVADLVDVYDGSNGAHIQVSIGSGNTINAVLKAGTVTEDELAAALLSKINEKADQSDLTSLAGVVSGLEDDLNNLEGEVEDLAQAAVQSVNGVLPDSVNDVQIIKCVTAQEVSEMYDDPEAANAEPGVLYAVPDDTEDYRGAGDLMNSPHLWEPDVEYEFEDGSCGRRFTGEITAAAAAEHVKVVSSDTLSIAIIDTGGGWSYDNSNGNFPLNGTMVSGTGLSSMLYYNSAYGFALVTRHGSARTNEPYDVWVRYLKED